MILRRVALIATAAFLLGACANGSGVSDPVAAPSSAAAAPSPSVAEPSGGVVDDQAKTLTGTVEEGVEPGCLILDGHQLIFDDQALKAAAKAGAKVTVSGRTQPGMMTTCMQGTPFLVTSVDAA